MEPQSGFYFTPSILEVRYAIGLRLEPIRNPSFLFSAVRPFFDFIWLQNIALWFIGYFIHDYPKISHNTIQ